MSLNNTPSSERIQIGFFGMRNAGKSSLVNAVTGQELSVVSDVKGTTTDPVKKAMELLPLGPVVIIDTPGLDDEGELGEKRIRKAREILARIDMAVLVVDAQKGMGREDLELVSLFEKRSLPYVAAFTKADLLEQKNLQTNPECSGRKEAAGSEKAEAVSENTDPVQKKSNDSPPKKQLFASAKSGRNVNALFVSAKTGKNINALKEMLGSFAKELENRKKLVSDLLRPGDIAVLVIPIDESAPKGRLILPQQQVMRDILDAHCTFFTTQDTELTQTLESLKNKPRLVITDSQAFAKVSEKTPEDILLTSFSILFARYKGNLDVLVRGASKLSRLKDGDRILICEGCTHHRQCNDIGSVKMPGWIEAYSGASPIYEFCSGNSFPEDLSPYAMIVHCGGCMLNEREMQYRIARAEDAGIPIVNYGIAIAQMHGILRRSLEIFPKTLFLLD